MRHGLLAAILTALAVWMGPQALPTYTAWDGANHVLVTQTESFSFDPGAALDVSDILDERPRRADWNHAYEACMDQGYTKGECYESVNDGEF